MFKNTYVFKFMLINLFFLIYTGGCKHALAFLMWCHRRSEEPSPTSVTSYWNRPVLSTAVASKDPVVCKNFGTNIMHPVTPHFDVLSRVLNLSRQQKVNSVLYETAVLEPIEAIEKLSVSYLMAKFMKSGTNVSFENFKQFSKQVMSSNEQLCHELYKRTELQSEEPLWFSMRYGRITASIFKEATACTTDGSLVRKITGAPNKFCSQFMKRGKDLEPLVLKEAEEKLKCKIVKSGLKLSPEYPLFGASADGITADASTLIEIKCPSSEATITSYVRNGVVKDKVKLQMQLQMLMHGLQKSVLCIASPNFEQNGEITTIPVCFENATRVALSQAEEFYENTLFPKLLKIYE